MPKAYAGGARPLEGGEWEVAGERWRLNPRAVLPPAYFHVVRLWMRSRSGFGGFAALPEAGGLNNQPAWLLEAFNVLANAEADAERRAKAERPADNGEA